MFMMVHTSAARRPWLIGLFAILLAAGVAMLAVSG